MTAPEQGTDLVEELNRLNKPALLPSLQRVLTEAADEITRLRLAAGWQDISSAPKQKVILLWAGTDIVQGEIRNWKMATGVLFPGYQGEPDYWEWEGRLLKAWDITPTHWQPLPSPPTSLPSGEQGEGENK